MRKLLVAAVLLVAAACGAPPADARPTPSVGFTPAQAGSPSAAAPSPSPAPARPAGLLFAVLENSGAGTNAQFQFQNDTVAIAGLDGYARAKQRFARRTVPGLCDAGLLTQPEARVAAGKVFYIDGQGVVRSLDPTGAVSQVTTFPMAAQQVVSFDVDPSGQNLLGARLTIPKYSGGLPCQQQGQFAMELLQAQAGGQAQTVYHQAYAQDDSSANFIHAVGWDPAGALITVHTSIGTQNGTLGQKWYGQLAHWSPQGLGSVVGGADCRAQDEAANSIACISSQGEGAGSVRGPDGSVQWNLPSAIYYFILLSPDGTRAAYCNSSQCGVAGKDGTNAKLPKGFGPTGWLDGSTLIGVTSGDQYGGVLGTPYGELATLSLSDLSKINDLGFKGMFAGVVQAS